MPPADRTAGHCGSHGLRRNERAPDQRRQGASAGERDLDGTDWFAALCRLRVTSRSVVVSSRDITGIASVFAATRSVSVHGIRERGMDEFRHRGTANVLQPHLQSALRHLSCILAAGLGSCSENRRAFPLRIVVSGSALQIGVALLLLKFPVARDALFSPQQCRRRADRCDQGGHGLRLRLYRRRRGAVRRHQSHELINFAFRRAAARHRDLGPCRRCSGTGGSCPHRGARHRLRAAPTARHRRRGRAWRRPPPSSSACRGAAAHPPLSRQVDPLRIVHPVHGGPGVVAGTVFVLYATILKPVLPGALGHILIASMMSLPGARADRAHHDPGRRGDRHGGRQA